MKHVLLCGTALAALALSAVNAGAAGYPEERWPRWYVGLNGSVTFVNDADLAGSSAGEVQLDNGWGLGASLGYAPPFAGGFLGGLRIEGEYLYQQNDFGKATVAGVTTPESGNVTAQAVMLNGLYDIRTESNLVPYLGAGIGWATVEIDRMNSVAVASNDDSALAWQLMFGLGYEPESIPGTVWSLGYRYFATGDLEYGLAGGGSMEMEYDAHRVDVGARFRF